MLKNIGHHATIVENGKRAVDEVVRGVVDYDLVLMDIQMPEMDGVEATKQLRQRGWTKDLLPVLGLTASFQTAQLEYYLDIGMNDCIGKPVRMKALGEIIAKAKGTCQKQ